MPPVGVRDDPHRAGHLAADPGIAPINWVTVSWVATAGHPGPWNPTPAGSARQHPGPGDHRADCVEKSGSAAQGQPDGAASRSTSSGETPPPSPPTHTRTSTADRRSPPRPSRCPTNRAGSATRSPEAITSAWDRRPPTRLEQVGEHHLGEQLPAMHGQEREHPTACSRCPATDSTSKISRCGSARPCTHRSSQPTPQRPCRHAPYFRTVLGTASCALTPPVFRCAG